MRLKICEERYGWYEIRTWNAKSIETWKSVVVIEPRIEILVKNLIIPFALEWPQTLHEYFRGNDEQHNGSKNLAMVTNMVLLAAR